MSLREQTLISELSDLHTRTLFFFVLEYDKSPQTSLEMHPFVEVVQEKS